jgi:hypothetical protein
VPTRHYQTSTRFLRLDASATSAHTLYLVLALGGAPDASARASTGVYEDEFVRTDAGWRFARRVNRQDPGGWLWSAAPPPAV